MKGKVEETPFGFKLVLTAKNQAERDWIENAFRSIKVGCLNCVEGEAKTLLLWTDNTPAYCASVDNNKKVEP
jgi:hypothetical protein